MFKFIYEHITLTLWRSVCQVGSGKNILFGMFGTFGARYLENLEKFLKVCSFEIFGAFFGSFLLAGFC